MVAHSGVPIPRVPYPDVLVLSTVDTLPALEYWVLEDSISRVPPEYSVQ